MLNTGIVAQSYFLKEQKGLQAPYPVFASRLSTGTLQKPGQVPAQ
jgi:hypothetical protein